MDIRSRVLRWIAAGSGALLIACVTAAAPSAAATSSFDVGDQTVVIVQVRGKGNEVTVRSWDRPTVQIDSGEDAPAVERHSVVFGTAAFPLAVAIPPMQWTQRDATGQVATSGMLPPEDFPYAGFRPGTHDTIRVTADAGAHLTVTVPSSTGILQVRVGAGQTSIDGFRGGNLFVVQNGGRVQLTNSTTTAFAQMGYGVLDASDDTFERIRVRTNAAHVVFEHCHSKQIETSSVSGSVVYDGGTFDPGLARFESQSGNVALGVSSSAQLSGRSQDGHVYTQFDHHVAVEQHGDGEATATLGSGGPLVNAISGRGNVYLYDGTLSGRHAPPMEWRTVHQVFNAHRRAHTGEAQAPPRPLPQPRRPPGVIRRRPP
ncbi:MAG: hypothetical protein NVS3B7_14530 [Candidatus Elarobacter sp.]